MGATQSEVNPNPQLRYQFFKSHPVWMMPGWRMEHNPLRLCFDWSTQSTACRGDMLW